MNRRTLSAFVLLLLVTVSACRAKAPAPAPAVADTYANPLDVIIADPFVLRHNNTYFLYGTTVANEGLQVFSSENLIDWQYRGWALRKTRESWGRNRFWAPECFEHKGKFYLHYSAASARTSLRIGLAVADSPTGPFTDVKTPWVDPGQAVIDSHVFRDDDGRLYLYYVIDCSENTFSEIRVCPLSDDLVPDLAKSAFVARPSQKWEGDTWNEGPFVIKHGGLYYLMYSGNAFGSEHYGLGYATAKSPMGPWTKSADNPVLQRNEQCAGPGHNSLIASPDGKELFVVYHTLQNPGFNAARQLAVDRMHFDGAKLVIDGPTVRPQPMPAGAAPLVRGQNEDFSAKELDRHKWMVFREDPGAWLLKDGRLQITTDEGDVAEKRDDLRNLFLQYAPPGDFDVVAKVDIHATVNYQHAFLCLWQDHDNFVKVVTVYSDKPRLEVGIERDGVYESHLFDNTIGDTAYLKIARRGDKCSFAVSRDGGRWVTLMAGVEAPMYDLRAGVGAASPGTDRQTTARFDFVRFTSP